ncbi:aldo/keto reductase [Hydrogenophaga sp. PBL-H3]|uniref:aldo/keto reductase n=1 Tax=Hydrogenophaga sp. PBL-H3 TaxID=434010 RepID=UPI00131F970A|nr:aldo/keto reductase [Hydrogenophaga sp. PBL-H3]QHE77773.1 oxidoreductase [Hydrogenophaga sp. PBL-H3]QHE82197.1 oxidoreductase [Hydrogenophaga sp. PBL-H3]
MSRVPLIESRGAVFSRIAAGAWRMAEWGLTPQQRLGWIEACLDLGITTFDHADIYGGYTVEALFGEALALQPALRQRMQIVGKCGIRLVNPQRPGNLVKHYDTSPAHVRASVENSLQQLRTDHLDVLLIHRPDALMNAAELADVFTRLRTEGKVLHFGVSNHTPSQLALLDAHIPLVTHQLECSPLHLDALHDGAFDQAQALGFLPMVWSPMAGGRLFTGGDDASVRVRGVLTALASEWGSSPEAVAIAWLLRHPARPVPVLGSRRAQAYQQAADAMTLNMDAQSWYRVWSAGAGRAVA